MRKIMIVLSVALLLSLASVSAFADDLDYKLGVNVKGSDPQVAFEFGADGDYFGSYVQVGLTNVSGLGGMTLSTPNNPFFLFGGMGAKLGSKTIAFTDTDTDTDTDTIIIPGWNVTDVSYSYSSVSSYGVDTITMFGEAGIGIDCGPAYVKAGWTNFDGDTVTFTMGFSL